MVPDCFEAAFSMRSPCTTFPLSQSPIHEFWSPIGGNTSQSRRNGNTIRTWKHQVERRALLCPVYIPNAVQCPLFYVVGTSTYSDTLQPASRKPDTARAMQGFGQIPEQPYYVLCTYYL